MSRITVVTAASERYLLTLAEARAQLGGIATSLTDPVLTTHIAQVTALVELALNRVLPQDRVIETFHVGGWREFCLSRYPIKTLHSVTVDGVELTVDTDYDLTEPEAGIVRISAGLSGWDGGYLGGYALQGAIGHSIGLYTGAQVGRRQDWAFNYTAGYGMADSSGVTPTVPEPLKIAAVDAIRAQLLSADRDASVTAMSLGDASWSFAKPEGGGGAASMSIKASLTGLLSSYVRPIL